MLSKNQYTPREHFRAIKFDPRLRALFPVGLRTASDDLIQDHEKLCRAASSSAPEPSAEILRHQSLLAVNEDFFRKFVSDVHAKQNDGYPPSACPNVLLHAQRMCIIDEEDCYASLLFELRDFDGHSHVFDGKNLYPITRGRCLICLNGRDEPESLTPLFSPEAFEEELSRITMDGENVQSYGRSVIRNVIETSIPYGRDTEIRKIVRCGNGMSFAAETADGTYGFEVRLDTSRLSVFSTDL